MLNSVFLNFFNLKKKKLYQNNPNGNLWVTYTKWTFISAICEERFVLSVLHVYPVVESFAYWLWLICMLHIFLHCSAQWCLRMFFCWVCWFGFFPQKFWNLKPYLVNTSFFVSSVKATNNRADHSQGKQTNKKR